MSSGVGRSLVHARVDPWPWVEGRVVEELAQALASQQPVLEASLDGAVAEEAHLGAREKREGALSIWARMRSLSCGLAA